MIFIVGSVFALFFGSTPILGQETILITPSINPLRKTDVENRQDIRQGLTGNSTNLQENVLKRKDNVATKQAIKDEKKIAKQAQFEEMKAKFEMAREEFKTKIQTLKDEQKKLVVERVDGRLAEINKNQTDRMSERLNRMTEIAGRIQERITDLANRPTDKEENIGLMRTALDGANTAIEIAKTAVSEQAAKQYIMTITDETVLKNSAETVKKQLQTDLQTTHKTVVAAKQALASAHKTILSIRPKPTNTTESAPTIIPISPEINP